MTTAPDLARFQAAALAGPEWRAAGTGVLNPAGVRLALTAAPAAGGAGASATASGCWRAATGSPTTRAPTAAGGPAWPCLPDRRAGIAALANGDDGAVIDAVVQRWLEGAG